MTLVYRLFKPGSGFAWVVASNFKTHACVRTDRPVKQTNKQTNKQTKTNVSHYCQQLILFLLLYTSFKINLACQLEKLLVVYNWEKNQWRGNSEVMCALIYVKCTPTVPHILASSLLRGVSWLSFRVYWSLRLFWSMQWFSATLFHSGLLTMV